MQAVSKFGSSKNFVNKNAIKCIEPIENVLWIPICRTIMPNRSPFAQCFLIGYSGSLHQVILLCKKHLKIKKNVTKEKMRPLG